MGKSLLHEHCPNCDSTNLGDRWAAGRMLSQFCNECDWQAPARIPEQKEIPTTKRVTVGQFHGFHYEVFDRYGHIMTLSRTYCSESEAKDNLDRELKRGLTDKNAGPYKGVLWPAMVEVKGEVFE